MRHRGVVQGRWWDQSIGGGVRRGVGWSELREEGTELRLMGSQERRGME